MCHNNMVPTDINARKLISKSISHNFSRLDSILYLFHQNKIEITPQHYLLISKHYLAQKEYEKLYQLTLFLINEQKTISFDALKVLIEKFFVNEKEKSLHLFDVLIENDYEIEFDIKMKFIDELLKLKDIERFESIFSLILDKNQIGNLDNLWSLLLSHNQLKYIEKLLNYMIERKIEPDSVLLSSFLLILLPKESEKTMSFVDEMFHQGMNINSIIFDSLESYFLKNRSFSTLNKLKKIRTEQENQ
eukprot:gene78-4327_t